MDKLIRKFKKQDSAETVKLNQKMAFQKVIKIAFKKRLAVEAEVDRRFSLEEAKYDTEINFGE